MRRTSIIRGDASNLHAARRRFAPRLRRSPTHTLLHIDPSRFRVQEQARHLGDQDVEHFWRQAKLAAVVGSMAYVTIQPTIGNPGFS